MKIFFYGLFMDQQLLESRGIRPREIRLGFLDDYQLRIGERATLIRREGRRAYGATMEISPADAAALYAEESVSDYVAEPVVVELLDGTRLEAACYNLPADKISGTNKEYAAKLLAMAERLRFPGEYLDEIRQAL